MKTLISSITLAKDYDKFIYLALLWRIVGLSHYSEIHMLRKCSDSPELLSELEELSMLAVQGYSSTCVHVISLEKSSRLIEQDMQ